MSEKVKIDKIKPDGSEGEDLKQYYFQQDLDGINFYSPTGQGPLNEIPVSFGVPFSVTLEDGSTWTLNATGMTGTWQNPALVGDPGDGTFQAQAGGTGEPEDETASSAYA